MTFLIVIFFTISFLYSMVGFGGGSSYIAFLALANIPYQLIPKIALICNLIVVAGSSYLYLKRKLIAWKILLPIVLTSAPMAFMGGLYRIDQRDFYFLLIFSLFLIALKILFIKPKEIQELKPLSLFRSLLLGSTIGFLSGVVGLGGGIFLSPVLIWLGHLRSKNAAAISCVFILINSFFGLLGQFIKADMIHSEIENYLPLFIVVLIGGQIGARVGTNSKTSYAFIHKATGLLIVIICINLMRKFI